ncbi:MAG: hypothetical protein H6740_01585 [Alphaproteobacteria bacterium]|nr:hypothetical protein [Alphaproteobacteria bacterium]
MVVEGAPALSWSFLTQPHGGQLLEGGVLPAIAGTIWVTVIHRHAARRRLSAWAPASTSPEYAPQSRWTRGARVLLRTLAGVPSVLIGIFGVVLFVDAANMGLSVLAAGCTLGLLSAPGPSW